jgi:hypothetical protein
VVGSLLLLTASYYGERSVSVEISVTGLDKDKKEES